ncbi:MAG: MarR family winged helix-turn-helix transcriptional regulator [Rhizobiaceae bacterium]
MSVGVVKTLTAGAGTISREIDPTALHNVITYRLARLYAKLNASATRSLASTDNMTLSRWRILVVLNAMGEGTLTGISQRTELDKGQLSRDITRMVADGWLKTKADSEDMRQQTLSISEKGMKQYHAAKPAMDTRQACLEAALAPKERAVLFTAIEKLEAVTSCSGDELQKT